MKAVTEAVAGERVRIRAIVESVEAKGRERSASSFAFETSLEAGHVIKLLGSMRLDADVEVDAAVRRILQAGGRQVRGAQQESRP